MENPTNPISCPTTSNKLNPLDDFEQFSNKTLEINKLLYKLTSEYNLPTGCLVGGWLFDRYVISTVIDRLS